MVHVDADLLLIDEVLAVGDAAFQEKCYDVLQEARDEGRTILLVTHDMGQVQRFCDRALLLDRGRVVAVGDSRGVARQYTQLNFATPEERESIVARSARRGRTGDAVTIVDAWAQSVSAEGRTTLVERGEAASLAMRVRFDVAVDDPVFVFEVVDEHERRVLVLSSDRTPLASGAHAAGDEVDVVAAFENYLAPGRYWIWPRVTAAGGEELLAFREGNYPFAIGGMGIAGTVIEVAYAFAVSPAPSMTQPTP
jgi:ABC-type molybdate transport system ATPase subunit